MVPTTLRRRRRPLVAISLALVLAVEVVGLAAARSLPGSAASGPPGPAASTVDPRSDRSRDPSLADLAGSTLTPSAEARGAASTAPTFHRRVPDPGAVGVAERTTALVDPTPRIRSTVGAADRPRPELPVAAQSTTIDPSKPKPATTSTASGGSYRGRNHVWIPGLGISRSIAFFPCSRSQPPGNHVYRWGCAGTNNVYLFGHAYSVFKPLHDAYVAGRLTKGLMVWYADDAGRVRVYSVAWWKVVLPTPDSKWAWAPQSSPSMTLQTCVGRNSEYRLMVRLTQVG